eukprot:TRINITY_DN7080_c0_g1_i1.p1 TRINITY_DN7080_c0_g1~~TRINITY_DN7080_c0_g1_i1.p1  ORF type:complete len:486 (+),score=179.89 TRINITY_DN7080_c0_g1_i1:130-1587(+)
MSKRNGKIVRKIPLNDENIEEDLPKKKLVKYNHKAEEEEEDNDDGMDENDEVNQRETPEEKRVRMAKMLIKEMRREIKSTEEESGAAQDEEEVDENAFDAEDLDRQIIASRFKAEADERMGKLDRKAAHLLVGHTFDESSFKILKGHQRSVTCVAISDDETQLFSGSKDCNLIRWDIESGKKLHVFKGKAHTKKDVTEGHNGEILTLALSTDGRFMVSGGTDKENLIRVWDLEGNKHLDNFKGHRKGINSIAFRQGANQIYSASNDRTIKVWDIENMMFVDTLYGHQAEVLSVDCLSKERPISSGLDKTIHLWKVTEETQLEFKGLSSSIDCVSYVNNELFVSGCQDGSVSLWSSAKKKPISTLKLAHFFNIQKEEGNESENTLERKHGWISSVAALKYSDLFASGSNDGFIRLWKIERPQGEKTPSGFKSIGVIPMHGWVNSLAFSKNGKFLVAGIGRDHRLGRWDPVKTAKNSIVVIPLPIFL